jgi:hypothetical protein
MQVAAKKKSLPPALQKNMKTSAQMARMGKGGSKVKKSTTKKSGKKS